MVTAGGAGASPLGSPQEGLCLTRGHLSYSRGRCTRVGTAGDFTPKSASRAGVRTADAVPPAAGGVGGGSGLRGDFSLTPGCVGDGLPRALLPPPPSSAPGTALPGASPSSSSARLITGHRVGPQPLALQGTERAGPLAHLGVPAGPRLVPGPGPAHLGLVVSAFTEENRKQSIRSPGGSPTP